jgi:hypothetical protein
MVEWNMVGGCSIHVDVVYVIGWRCECFLVFANPVAFCVSEEEQLSLILIAELWTLLWKLASRAMVPYGSVFWRLRLCGDVPQMHLFHCYILWAGFLGS